MKKILVTVKNPAEEIHGLHFFAQCLNELLSDDSDDSYKAPALNLVTRLIELQRLSRNIKQSEISTESIRPFLEELEWGLNIDPVINEDEKDHALAGLKRLLIGAPAPNKIEAYTDWVWDGLVDYFDRLRSKVEQTILDGNKKELLRALAISFAAHVEVEGFSRRFAYQHVQRKLINVLSSNKKISVEKVIRKFFSRFDRKPTESVVYYKGSGDFLPFASYVSDWGMEILSDPPCHNSNDPAHIEFFTANENTVFIAVKSIEAKDPYAARDRAEAFINIINGVIRYHCHDVDMHFSNNCIVETKIDGRSIFSIIGLKPNPVLCGSAEGVIQPDVIKRLTQLIAGHHLNERSTQKYQNALTYHRGAIGAPLYENQLVALWSALEGLLPNPEASEVRVRHFAEIIVGVLVLSYPQKLFSIVAKQLHENCSSAVIAKINSLTGKSWTEKVMALICCEEYEDERYFVASTLDEIPLLRYRMKELYDSFSSAGKINRTLQKHKSKVTWHISRIYWNRNLIVHSAQSMPYLATIVENLHDYLDTVMDGIALYASQSKAVTSIEAVAQAILTDAELRITTLGSVSKKQDITSNLANHCELIIGSGNVFVLS